MGSQDLQQARYDQLVRRVGALYGGGSKVVEVLPEVFPVLELENTTPELLALSGWRLAWQSTERPADAVNNSASQLRNPAGSGMIIAVTQLGLRAAGADTKIQGEISTTVFGTPVPGLYRDSRFGTPRNTTGQVATAVGIPVGGGLRWATTVNIQDRIEDINGIVVLTPGSNLNLGTVNDNITLTVNYFWRERLAQESELNFP